MSVEPSQPDRAHSRWSDYWANRAPGALGHLSRPLRILVAATIALCGGLALLYFVFAAIGAVDLAEASTFTIIAVILALIWFVAFVLRYRTGAIQVQRPDRERRGY